MEKTNITEVRLQYRGSSVLAAAIGMSGTSSPSHIADWLQRHFRLAVDGILAEKISLTLIFNALNGKQEVTFRLFEFEDIHADDFGLNGPNSEMLHEFIVSLPSALGRKNWQFYVECKESGIMEVNTPAQGEKLWEAQQSMHDLLAHKLKEKLDAAGLKDLYFDGEDITMERELIQLFLEYKNLSQNPQALRARLGV